MTENDVIFKIYDSNDNPDQNCFCHFGWEGVGEFAFWKYACAYYESAKILFEKFKDAKGDNRILDGIGLPICFLYRHFVELSHKYLFIKFVGTNEQEFKDCLSKGQEDIPVLQNLMGAWRTSMIYSFFEACWMNHLNPQQWLTYVLNNIKTSPANPLQNLQPQNFDKSRLKLV